MPKPKKKEGFDSPSTPNPVHEMSWCFERKIRVIIEPEAFQQPNGYYKQTNRYAICVDNAGVKKCGDFVYTKADVLDAVHNLYLEIYKRNYGKIK